MKTKYITKSGVATQKIGEKLAYSLLKKGLQKSPQIISLEGELGAGKTTFLQGFARGLKIKEKILSPTFVLLKRFKIKDAEFKNFYHIDCYRLKKEKDLETIGLNEILLEPKNVIAVEWPLKKINSLRTVLVRIKQINLKEREIEIFEK